MALLSAPGTQHTNELTKAPQLSPFTLSPSASLRTGLSKDMSGINLLPFVLISAIPFLAVRPEP